MSYCKLQTVYSIYGSNLCKGSFHIRFQCHTVEQWIQHSLWKVVRYIGSICPSNFQHSHSYQGFYCFPNRISSYIKRFCQFDLCWDLISWLPLLWYYRINYRVNNCIHCWFLFNLFNKICICHRYLLRPTLDAQII